MRRRLVLTTSLIAVLAVCALSTLAWIGRQGHGRIAPGVSVEGVALGGLTAAQARARLHRQVAAPAREPVVVAVEGRQHVFEAVRAGVSIDVEGAARRALALSREQGALAQGWRRLRGSRLEAELSMPVRVDRAAVHAFVDRVARGSGRPARDATFRITPTAVAVTEGSAGRRLADRQQLMSRVRAALAAPGTHRDVNAETEAVAPRVTAEQLRQRHPTLVTVSREGRTVRLFRRGRVVKTYKAAVGNPGNPTPTGTFSVQAMQKDPSWNVPNSDWAGDLAGKTIPAGDPRNPLIDRWIGFAGAVGFHGTNEAQSLGQAASRGCVRMAPADVRDLFTRVDLGTTVVVG